MPRESHSSAKPHRSAIVAGEGFTLVELLVVIGIIALLIAMLMPALSKARQIAQRTACAAKLQQILLAAQLQSMDHKGFYPLAGVLPGFMPADLEDRYSGHYDYLPNVDSNGVTDWLYPIFPAPITFSLAHEMSHRGVFAKGTNDVLGPEETDDQGLIRHFICPSQASSTSEIITQQSLLFSCSRGSQLAPIAYIEAQSYNFNEVVCGWNDAPNSGSLPELNRLKGRAHLVHQPALTLFVADGLTGSNTEPRIPFSDGYGMSTWYNIAAYAPITLADALTGDGKAGDPENFDLHRHQGKINIGFCDGHVETRNITAKDLTTVYLMAP